MGGGEGGQGRKPDGRGVRKGRGGKKEGLGLGAGGRDRDGEGAGVEAGSAGD
jgi:hypothetical protein